MSKKNKPIPPTVIRAAARRVGLAANVGHKAVLRAVSERIGEPYPSTRSERTKWLMAFNAAAPAPPTPEPKAPRRVVAPSFATSDEFLASYEWRRLRYTVLREQGRRCQCCGATPATGAIMNVDHIKPRRLFPALALEKSNLQVLCHECNHGKGNWDQTDWRPEPAPLPAAAPRLVKPTRPLAAVEAPRGIVAEASGLDEQYRRLIG